LKTLITLYSGCIEFEVLLAAHLLGPKYPVLIATPTGEDYKSSNGMTFKSDLSYRAIRSEEFAALLVPGGDPTSVVGNENLNHVVRSIHKQGANIGAVCAGPFVLAQAGILKGKKIAHGYDKDQLDFLKNYFVGVQLTNDIVKVDGNIVTAKPQGHVEFAIEIARLTGAIADESHLQRLLHFYKAQS